MNYYLVYSMSGYYIDIKHNIEGVLHPFIEINEKTFDEVIKARSDGLIVKVVNDSINYLINENKKRERIVSDRDNILDSVIPYANSDWYRNKNLPDATAEQLNDLEELYNRLLDMPQHYDLSDDKQSWDYRWVDEYTSGKNTNNYQLKRLDFIKWKN